jgi:hypothetical protein
LAGTPSPGTAEFGDLPGDFTGDGVVDAADINVLFGAISSGNMAAEFDLNDSGVVDQEDVKFLVENIIGTSLGDANLDGKIDAMDLNQVGINWRRMDGAGWEAGDFTGDGTVDAMDLNLIGINWRRGEAAAAPANQRVPRAPLAAGQAVPVAIVDEAIERVSRDLSSKPDGTTSAQINGRSVDDGSVLSRSRYDAAKSRRGSLPRDDAFAEPEEAKGLQLIDELFGRM